jgi:hypothetical protein
MAAAGISAIVTNICAVNARKKFKIAHAVNRQFFKVADLDKIIHACYNGNS